MGSRLCGPQSLESAKSSVSLFPSLKINIRALTNLNHKLSVFSLTKYLWLHGDIVLLLTVKEVVAAPIILSVTSLSLVHDEQVTLYSILARLFHLSSISVI